MLWNITFQLTPFINPSLFDIPNLKYTFYTTHKNNVLYKHVIFAFILFPYLYTHSLFINTTLQENRL